MRKYLEEFLEEFEQLSHIEQLRWASYVNREMTRRMNIHFEYAPKEKIEEEK